MRINPIWKRLWDDEAGQSTTEYILILSVVVMIAMKFKQTFQSKITSAVDKIGSQIDQNISE
jgi:Flp pilus assembly pilin Flp